MKLRLEFGLHGPKRMVTWWNKIEDFPNILSYQGTKWEFVVYDKDLTKQVDYICIFSELQSYDPNWHSTCINLEDLAGLSRDNCECGAEAVAGLNTRHSTWCKKYLKY